MRAERFLNMLENSENTTETSPATRRRFLGLGAAIAAAGAAHVVHASAADASTGTMQYGAANNAGSSATSLTSSHPSYTMSIANTGSSDALQVVTDGLSPVFDAGVRVTAPQGATAFRAVCGANSIGLYVTTLLSAASANSGIYIDNNNFGNGMTIDNAHTTSSSPAIHVTASGLGAGLYFEQNNPANSAPGADFRYVGSGYGVFVDATGPGLCALYARSTKYGVLGVTTGTGAGICGSGGVSGRGAKFKSNVAQMWLEPSTLDRPASGKAGDFFVDKVNSLWFCKGGSSWVKLA